MSVCYSREEIEALIARNEKVLTAIDEQVTDLHNEIAWSREVGRDAQINAAGARLAKATAKKRETELINHALRITLSNTADRAEVKPRAYAEKIEPKPELKPILDTGTLIWDLNDILRD